MHICTRTSSSSSPILDSPWEKLQGQEDVCAQNWKVEEKWETDVINFNPNIKAKIKMMIKEFQRKATALLSIFFSFRYRIVMRWFFPSVDLALRLSIHIHTHTSSHEWCLRVSGLVFFPAWLCRLSLFVVFVVVNVIHRHLLNLCFVAGLKALNRLSFV